MVLNSRQEVSSIKELLGKGFSADEAISHYEDIFKFEYGYDLLRYVKRCIEKARLKDGILYAEISSEEYVWFVDIVVEKMSIDGICKHEFLIKVESPAKRYFYRGIRAKSVRLFSNCGGEMSKDRELWQSLPGSKAELAMAVVFEDYDVIHG